MASKLQKEIITYLKDKCYFFKTVRSNTKGVADIIGCANGKFFAFEVKESWDKPSTLQLLRVHQVKKNGGVAKVVYSLAEVKEILEPLLNN